MDKDQIHAEIAAADEALIQAFIRRSRAVRRLRETRAGDEDVISADLAADAAMVRRFASETPEDMPADAIARICRAVIGEAVQTQGIRAVRFAGGDEATLVNAARGYFGYSANLVEATDPREALEAVEEEKGVVACLPWPELSGAGQWWPMLNENRFSDLRILAGWPNLPGQDASLLETAIVARKALSPSGADDMFAIAHDDLYEAERIVKAAGMTGEVVARVRSLALIKLEGFVAEDDSRLAAARSDGLEGMRIIGVLPRP